MPQARFPNKVSIVTGAGGGLGSAISYALAAEGATVVLVDLNEEAVSKAASEINASGGKALALKVDVTDRQEVNQATQRVITQFGRIDILVNNAGFNIPNNFRKQDEALWDKIIAINLKGVLLFTRAVLDGMVEQRYGKIINITSDAVKGQKGSTIYSAAKAGVVSFTRSLCLEVARYRINVNCVSPAILDTQMLHDIVANTGGTVEDLVKYVPWGRIPRAEDLVPTVLFLASDETEMITGQTISVNGGLGISMLG